MDFTGFLLGFTGFYWALLDFTSFYLVYWVSLDFTGFYWVLMGFTGFYWVHHIHRDKKMRHLCDSAIGGHRVRLGHEAKQPVVVVVAVEAQLRQVVQETSRRLPRHNDENRAKRNR